MELRYQDEITGRFKKGLKRAEKRGLNIALLDYGIENPEYTLYPQDIMVQFKSKKNVDSSRFGQKK